jgi:hypothetical protein
VTGHLVDREPRRDCHITRNSDKESLVQRFFSAFGVFLLLSSGAPVNAQITAGSPAPIAPFAAGTPVPPGKMINIPSGELVSVELQSDIGSRISNEGDTFAIVTLQDVYIRGSLVLPKGSPGYGVITHVKRAGSFHAGGELTFTVKRLIAPDGSEIACETNGATSDADKETEKNGSEIGQYLLWGVGMFAKRGNDLLIKKGASFHVATLQTKDTPVVAYGKPAAKIDSSLLRASNK